MYIDYLKNIKHNNMGYTGIIMLFVIFLIAVLAPLISPYSPDVPSIEILKHPIQNHLLGTNDIGQDVFSRVIYGTRTSLLISISVGILTVGIGAFLGGTAALIGGFYERLVMRTADVLLTLPNIMIIILISAYVQPGIIFLIILLSVLHWQGSARIVRSQTLSIKNKMHVSAAKTFGANDLYILKNHIIPDMGPILISGFIQHARRAVFMEAGLAFLGIADPTMISWGTMLNHALQFSYMNMWFWILPPGIMLSFTVLAFSFVGYSIENKLNTRLRLRKYA